MADAQSFNIDFGVGLGPSSAFSGAGEAGVWNSIPGNNGVWYAITSTDGATTAQVKNIGGFDLIDTDNPGTTGDDDALLDDFLVTYSPTLESCLFFEGLDDGDYQVITYAWFGTSSETKSWVTVDQSLAPGVLVGGAWPGGLVEGVIYSVHAAHITGGHLEAHSGVPSGAPIVAAALNGIQLVRLDPPPPPEFVRGDANGDGAHDIGDAIATLDYLFAAGPLSECASSADANDDGAIDIGDAIFTLAYLFTDGMAPSAPYPGCGVDPTSDVLACTQALCP